MQEAYIVAYGRSAVAKGKPSGALYHSRPDDIAAQVLKGTIDRIEGDFDPTTIEDVIVGCSTPEGPQGTNVARTIALRAGLSQKVPGQTVNRFCSSGLQTIATAANSIIAGQNDIVAAGGVEFMSSLPMGGNEATNNPTLQEEGPKTGIPMGITAENVADKYNISREDQDAFAVESHRRAAAAQEAGRFDEIIPVNAQTPKYTENGVEMTTTVFDKDETIRPSSSMESLAKLPTAFRRNGTVTPGQSSPITDGAGFVVLMSGDKVKELGVKPIAKFVGFKVAGVSPEIMGIGPVEAVPAVMKLTGLNLEDMDLIEFNEAFGSQIIASMRELNMDPEITNVNGGAIALGHPLGATGAIMTAKILSEMKRRKDSKYGLITMCIGGGMGAAGILEYVGER
ncbi:3-ketoacyl-CoA thiolase [Alloiococcus otitis]|uniref:acetyl-CoA C-acyltransferase n=1 Tax=Alloiococcus otitis ATCC 51267 TaxID=883081 RepID=K9ERA3_9LACT|nr:thiolase family protein [Alloiococcus otitis]EKU93402.1 acetyl-CoA C-acetyltransferase [Alloiococcus otitis ATCC 51267]SUU81619.1 3-ketoacyl-CoA thiolase [Alloiococcus otitis]